MLKLTPRDSLEVLKKLQALKLLDFVENRDQKDPRKFYEACHLAKEIVALITLNHGRMVYNDIMMHFNIDRSDVKRILTVYSSEISETLYFINSTDEIILESYLNRIVNNIDEIIEIFGKISSTGLAKHLCLPLDFTIDRILHHPNVSSRMKNGFLYSQSFITNLHQQIFDLCEQSKDNPLSIMIISSKLVVDDQEVLEIIIKGLSSGRLQGEVISRAYHHPDLLLLSKSNVLTEFETRQFLYLSQIKQHVPTSKPMDYLKEICKHPYVTFSNLIISPHVLDNLRTFLYPSSDMDSSSSSSATASINRHHIVALSSILPHGIDVKDINEITQKVMGEHASTKKSKDKKPSPSLYMITSSAIAIHQMLLDKMRGAAAVDAQEQCKRICDRVVHRLNSHIDSTTSSSQVSLKKKQSKSKDEDGMKASKSITEQGDEMIHYEVTKYLTQHRTFEIWRLYEVLNELFEGDASVADHSTWRQEIFDMLLKDLIVSYKLFVDKMLWQHIQMITWNVKEREQVREELFSKTWDELLVIARGICCLEDRKLEEVLTADDSDIGKSILPIHGSILRDRCRRICVLLTISVCFDNDIQTIEYEDISSPTHSILRVNIPQRLSQDANYIPSIVELKALLRHIPRDVRFCVQQMWTMTNATVTESSEPSSPSIWSFMRMMISSASVSFNLIVHKPDKKRDKLVIAMLRSQAIIELRQHINISYLHDKSITSSSHNLKTNQQMLMLSIQLLFNHVHSSSWMEYSDSVEDHQIIMQYIIDYSNKLHPQLIDASNTILGYLTQPDPDYLMLLSVVELIIQSIE